MGGNKSKSAKASTKKGKHKVDGNLPQGSFMQQHTTEVGHSSHSVHYQRTESLTSSQGTVTVNQSNHFSSPSHGNLFPHSTASAGSGNIFAGDFTFQDRRSTWGPRVRGPLLSALFLQSGNAPIMEGKDKMDAKEKAHIDIRVRTVQALITPTSSHIPMYNTTGDKRGMALIINNVDFPEKPRRSAELDGQHMYTLLQRLRLEPKLVNNLRGQDMKNTLERYAANKSLWGVDMCVVVIMSHGTGSMDTMTKVSGVDYDTLKVCDIIAQFSSKNCHALKGKPKIFIIQCCRGDQPTYEQDTMVFRTPTCEDMLIAYSTAPGFQSYREVGYGSIYIREICKVFMHHAHDTHVEDMLKKVGENVKNTPLNQYTTYENSSFKNCYFNPV